MAFHEVRFPADLSFGSSGGPERRTEIVALTNGFEERNTPWSQSRHRYDAGVGMRSLDDIARLVAFFEAREGQLHGFRWKDWSDYKSCAPSDAVGFADQILGTGDGDKSVFQLKKTYASGAFSYSRDIYKPVESTVLVGISQEEQVLGIHYDIDFVQGEIVFNAPPDAGEVITAGFEFDVPVRFDSDAIITSVASFQAGDVPSVPVVEIRV